MPRLTIWGMMIHEPTLFDKMELPEGIDKDILIAEIMASSGDLYPYIQVPERVKENIGLWSRRRQNDFAQMYRALTIDYNPIENYDRHENITRNALDSGSDSTSGTTSSTGNTSSSSNETQEGESKLDVSAYDDNGYNPREKTTQTVSGTSSSETNDTLTGNNNATTTYGKHRDETETSRIHGNIGVTTSQDMITQEMELRVKYDLYRVIAKLFENEFLVQIY